MSFLKMPLSGTISVADVNTVYVKPAGTQENFDSEDFRELAGKPTPQTTIALSDLYGKVPRQKITIGADNKNSFNINLKTAARDAKPNVFAFFNGEPQETIFDFTIKGNIGSNSLTTFSLRTGSWHPTIGLVIRIGPVSYKNLVAVSAGSATGSPSNGIVAGRGANGTSSGCCDCHWCPAYSKSGGAAILIEHGSETLPTRIINKGIIGSGGTGGHGITMDRKRKHGYQGGGGAGIPGGSKDGHGGYGCGADGTYLEGGCGSFPGGDLGKGNGKRATRPAIIFGSYKYTIEGNGVVRGEQLETMPTTTIL